MSILVHTQNFGADITWYQRSDIDASISRRKGGNIEVLLATLLSRMIYQNNVFSFSYLFRKQCVWNVYSVVLHIDQFET